MCFSEILKYIPDSGLSRFPLGVSVYTQCQVKHKQRYSRTCRVQKNHKILRKNTLFNEHPVVADTCVDLILFTQVLSNSLILPLKKNKHAEPIDTAHIQYQVWFWLVGRAFSIKTKKTISHNKIHFYDKCSNWTAEVICIKIFFAFFFVISENEKYVNCH